VGLGERKINDITRETLLKKGWYYKEKEQETAIEVVETIGKEQD